MPNFSRRGTRYRIRKLTAKQWLVEAAPTFFKVAPTDRLSKRRKAERIQPLHNRFAGEDDWRLSAQKRQGRGGGGGTWG
jgi:ATP-dependent RNA helicase DHX8/PRP22